MLVNFCTGLKSIPRKQSQKSCQFMMLSKKSYQPQKLSVKTFIIDESDELELLGLTIDKEQNFSKHIDKLCRNLKINFML